MDFIRLLFISAFCPSCNVCDVELGDMMDFHCRVVVVVASAIRHGNFHFFGVGWNHPSVFELLNF